MGSLKRFIKNNWIVLLIWLFALTIRIVISIISKGYTHPDEYYQSIEIAYEKVFGIGRIPWEFEEGIRSWVYPGIIIGIFKLMLFLGASNFETLIIGVRLFSAFCSMISVVVSYYFAKYLFDKQTGIIATIFVSFWHDFIFWSGRAMGDSIAMNFVFLGCFLTFLCFPKKRKSGEIEEIEQKKRLLFSLFAGINFGIAFMFKFGSIVVVIPFFIGLLLYKKWKEQLMLLGSISFVIIIQGIIDQFTWGSFLHSAIEYLKFNIIEGSSSRFGVTPFLSYFAFIFDAYGEYLLLYVMFIILGINFSKRNTILISTFFFYFLVFSFIGHKEYRFLLPVMPILVLFAAKGFGKYPTIIKKGSIKKPALVSMILVTIAFSCVNSCYLKTFKPNYQQCLAMEWIGQQPDCNLVILVDGGVFNLPGYACLQNNATIEIISAYNVDYICYKYRHNIFYILIKEHYYLDNYDFCNPAFAKYNVSLINTFYKTHFTNDPTVFVFKKFN